ncbi:IclR family transcriptional regulator [Hirschia litorea]|uniref:IclR family transcriptional regulator n=1 Tax=Hirschia litorea TaxID=1199156 RepID=A0ABW2IH00_9PROT
MNEKTPSSLRSIRRCFQLFEIFDAEQQPMSASVIANKLDAPLTSIIDLLKCISELGYISYDSRSRTYFITPKISNLGEWLIDNPLHNFNYEELLRSLRDETRETIGIFSQNGTQMLCLAEISGLHPLNFRMSVGEMVPLFQSSVGHAQLAHWKDEDIKKTYLKRHKREDGTKLANLLKKVKTIRETNYSTGYGLVHPDVGAISVSLEISPERWVILCAGGVINRIKENEAKFSKALLSAIGK